MKGQTGRAIYEDRKRISLTLMTIRILKYKYSTLASLANHLMREAILSLFEAFFYI
jgi:hypothetical protein